MYNEKKEDRHMNNIYEELGVKEYINAYDTMTNYGGSRMSDETLEAYKAAACSFVDMRQLQEKISCRIAEMTGNEAAYITTGASMGITLAVCACMAGKDQKKIDRLPNTEGLKDEVIVFKSQRNPYDKAIEVSGAKLVEIGGEEITTKEELDAAIGEKTVCVYYIQATNHMSNLSIEDVVEVAHKKNVYVIVDAAAQLPPKENLSRFTKMGADIVAFSGGKAIHGPLNTGFIVGRKDLIEACVLCGFPNRSVARGGKVSREDMVALYVALKQYMAMSTAEYDAILRNRVDYIVEGLKDNDILGVYVEEEGPVGQIYPRAAITLKTDRFTIEEFAQALKDDEPGILMGIPLYKPYDCLYVNPLVMDDYELETVLKQLMKVSRNLNER